ncbi:helix-turn-helix domain-containing protein [Kitasatospora sp. NPDC089797]|uniref:helix-turn-helix domain-containing protein n=1 Tax=Kitasatospora sp. NPDC089797 TaxID=3155298 RepID=UPI0034416AA5
MATVVPTAMTVPEVMAALKVGRSTVYDLIRSKALPSFTVGNRRRFDAADVAAFMRTRIEENN